MLLSLVMAVGSHLGPRLLYGHRGFPETTTPAAHRRLAVLFGVGLVLLASFPLEAVGHARAGLVVPLSLIAFSVPVRLAAEALPAHLPALIVASSCLWLAGALAWGAVPKMAPWHVAPD